MVKNILQFTVFFSIIVIAFAFNARDARYSSYTANEQSQFPTSVEEALLMVGDKKPLHYINKPDADSARMGEEMIKFGNLLDGSNKRISKYFVCTDCHNLQLESENPADESPEAVLAYGMKNDIPFLPASTFYGMYNKRSWYNDDYYKKYGDLVKPTRDTLYNAVQLCATQCAQGRELEHWEVRTILHYYKTLELKISDLKFDENELDKFGKLIVSDKKEALKLLNTKYIDRNGAHFGSSEIPNIPNYQPNSKNGEYIFTKGCLHCHDAEVGITNFTMSNTALSLNFLKRKKNKYNHYSVPHITRHGTYAISGRKQYMPLYSFEKMSKEQMLDLLHYIDAKGK